PRRLVGPLEQNLEEQAPVAVLQHGPYFGSLHRLARQAGNHQRSEDSLRLQPVIEMGILQLLGELLPEAFRLREHPDQPPLDRLGSARDKFRLRLYFPASFRGRFTQSGAQNGFVQAKLLSDARGPFGAQNAVWNL